MMPLHLRDDCEYGEAQCPVLGCEDLLRRREVADHVEKMHGEEKRNAEATKRGEEEEFKDNEEEMHICPHAALGCPHAGPQKSSDHLSSCPYESLKGFFTSNTAKISLLTEQNMLLRHRVDTLETMVQTLRREMNAARNTLGPWFRVSYQVGGGLGLGTGPIMSSGVGITSSELPLGMQHYAAGPSQPMTAREDPLAPYFPPAENVVQRPAIGHQASSDTAYSRTGMMGVVAPLDLGTTLEGTLVGLRESMMGLAVGIDSVGRRSEIGLTNETLRLGEEIMSVRAQMHGLRMQMHGMMMDRNAALRSEEGQYFQPPILPPPPPPPNRNNMGFGVPPSITKL
ncbi:hypothetical protein BYT27DRAFT_7180601 [Phlegmacium glaucopus]|nr:hypothetical protein BYT27DRAFT_7180601 [Phlegmacium glaucopus]